MTAARTVPANGYPPAPEPDLTPGEIVASTGLYRTKLVFDVAA